MSDRDFLPRFYDPEGKVMLYWQCYMQSAFNRLTDTQHFGLLYNLLRNPGIIMMRCTGLRDKNGKLIFEGDIVSTTLSDGSKFKHIIRWYDGKFIADYGWYYHKEFEDYCSISQEWISKKEIIGNIHENHDLLEQSNDD